jgi:hypothetical protein
MQRHVLGIVTAAGLLSVGLTLFQTGWRTPRAAEPTAVLNPSEDPLNTAYGRRFTHNQPLHWRDVVLAH